MFQGVYTAIITPFHNGKVDEKKLEELLTFQVEAGMQGVVCCGTTGEFQYLSPVEQKRVIELCVQVCKGKIQVIAGCATLSIDDTIGLVHQAEKVGADGALVVTPWYVKPSQESLCHYYKMVSESVGLPLIVYNNPSRTGVDISLETVLRLASYDNIRGYKDSASNLQRTSELKGKLGDRLCLLAGNDDPFAAYLAMGGDGGILGFSNVAPYLAARLMKAWQASDLATFKTTWEAVFPLISALYLESIPCPTKYALTLTHGVSPETRLPFAPLKASTQEAVQKALQDLGLWNSLSIVSQR